MRSGSPGVRLGRALAASLVLHLILLLPAEWLPRAPITKPVTAPPLVARLALPETAPELATQIEPEAPPQAMSPPVAVPPGPTFGVVPPKPNFGKAPPPRELQGRALHSALAALSREEFYPREAIERGLEGRVVLLLALDESGRVATVDVASSSGHALLDAAARTAALRIGRLAGGKRQVLLPVEFRLE